MENVSKILVSCFYDGTNPQEVLEVMAFGTTYPLNIEYWNEETGQLTLAEVNPYSTNYLNIPMNKYVVAMPETGGTQFFTEAQFQYTFKYTKEIFLEAANDPDVIAVLKEAIENAA